MAKREVSTSKWPKEFPKSAEGYLHGKVVERNLMPVSPLKEQFEPTPASPVRQRFKMAGGCD